MSKVMSGFNNMKIWVRLVVVIGLMLVLAW